MHTLPMCYLQVSHKISQVTLLAHMYKYQVEIKLYCTITFVNVYHFTSDFIFKTYEYLLGYSYTFSLIDYIF